MSAAFQAAMRGFVIDRLRQLGQTADGEIKVVRIDFEYDPGYNYSSYTFEEPSFQVLVEYTYNDQRRVMVLYKDEQESMGKFLTDLLAWEDAQ